MQIGILDAMGSGNLGDAAIQDSVISNIKGRLPDAWIVGFSFFPDDTKGRHGIPSYPLTKDSCRTAHLTEKDNNRKNSINALKAKLKKVPVLRVLTRIIVAGVRETVFLRKSFNILKNLDLLIISGGGQICELWGGAWAHLFNLFKFSILAKLAGTRLYYLNVGAEPLKHWLSRFFAKSSIQLADYVSFRDEYSQAQLQKMGVKSMMHVYADPVYGLEIANYLNENSYKPSMPTVGINPIGYCDPRIWPRKEQAIYDDYMAKIIEFSVWLRKKGYCLKIFTTSAKVDDFAVSDLQQQLLLGSTYDNLNPWPSSPVDGVNKVNCSTVKEVLMEMSKCDYIITSRYHGVIFSHILHKPLISLNYQDKSDVAMKAVGLGYYSASIEQFDSKWLINAFNSLIHRSYNIKLQEARAVDIHTEILRRQFDELFSTAP